MKNIFDMLDRGKKIGYYVHVLRNSMKMKYELIQSSGGTGPMKLRQPSAMRIAETVLIPEGRGLKDER